MRLALALLLVLTGCRLETPPEEAPATDAPETAPPIAPLPNDPAAAPPEAADLGSAAEGPGLLVPVAGVALTDLADTFTDARSEGRSHDAIDIHAPRGTPVVAAAAGTVARLFESEKGGRTVYIVVAPGPPATVHYYAHLDAYAPGLAAGQRVRRGQRLGTVGDSGNATPGDTHLHFAIWRAPSAEAFWDGPAVNPYPLLGREEEKRD